MMDHSMNGRYNDTRAYAHVKLKPTSDANGDEFASGTSRAQHLGPPASTLGDRAV
jgi:hypothetical protein